MTIDPTTPMTETAASNEEMFGENVHVFEHSGKKIYLIGTAHVSEDSVDEVNHVIETVRPDTVCVELCQTRYDALLDEDRWKKLDIFKVIREGKALFLMANLAISGYQRRIGADLGVQPGSELLGAAKKADEVGSNVDLIDRDIKTTLKRTWANVGFLKKMKLMGAVFGSLLPGEEEEVTKEDIEKLKSGAQLSELMEEFSRALPEVKEPLIDERDRYMVEGIRQAPGSSVVAVVGAGHVPGMLASFDMDIDRDALSVIPPTKWWVRALKWLIPGLILAAFAIGVSTQDGGRTFEELLIAWVLPNCVVAAVLTAAVLAKPASIVAAFVASPITSLNPLLGAGMVVGLVEAWARRPTVEDCENIHRDVQSFGGFFKNPFTRVLVVAAAATLGSALGAWIGATWVVTIVAG